MVDGSSVNDETVNKGWKRKTNRRGFLRTTAAVAGVGAAGLVAGAVGKEHQSPGFLEKLKKSVDEGKVIQDAREVIDSHIAKPEVGLGEPFHYDDAWIAGFFPRADYFTTHATETPGVIRGAVGFFEVAKVDAVESLPHESAHEFLTLPSPQAHTPPGGQERYGMYANFGGNNYSPRERSPERGGLRWENGTVRVDRPGHAYTDLVPYEQFSPTRGDEGLVEYAVVLDSRHLVDEAKTHFVTSLSDKQMQNDETYSAAVVSYYTDEGEVHTAVLTELQNYQNGKFVPVSPHNYTVPQLCELAVQYQAKRQFSGHFLITFADPGANSIMQSSVGKPAEKWMAEGVTKDRLFSDDPKGVHYRTVGGEAGTNQDLLPPIIRVPYQLAAVK